MPPIFARLDSTPFRFWVQPQIHSSVRNALLVDIKKAGGQVVKAVAEADFVLVERNNDDIRLHAPGKIVLRYTWVHKCLDEGRLLGQADAWGGRREFRRTASSSVEKNVGSGSDGEEVDEDMEPSPRARESGRAAEALSSIPSDSSSKVQHHVESKRTDMQNSPTLTSTVATPFDQLKGSGLSQDTISTIQSVYSQFQQAVSAFLPPGTNLPPSPFPQDQPIALPPPVPPRPATPPPHPQPAPSQFAMQGMVPVLMPVQMFAQMSMWSSIMASMGMAAMPTPIPMTQLPDVGQWQQSMSAMSQTNPAVGLTPGWANNVSNPFLPSGSNMSTAHISVPPSPAQSVSVKQMQISSIEKGKGREGAFPLHSITPGPSGSDSPSEPRQADAESFESLDVPEHLSGVQVFSTERGPVRFYVAEDFEDRHALIDLISDNGGKCVGLAAADFVVLGDQNAKQTLSVTASLPSVAVSWIYDCIDSGTLLPVRNYPTNALVSSDWPEFDISSSSNPVSRSSTSQPTTSRPSSRSQMSVLGLTSGLDLSKRTPVSSKSSAQKIKSSSGPVSSHGTSKRHLQAPTSTSRQQVILRPLSDPYPVRSEEARTPSTKSRVTAGRSSVAGPSPASSLIPAKRTRDDDDSIELPSPPRKRPPTLSSGHHFFSEEDERYLAGYMKARVAQDPKVSMVTMFREIAANASWHSAQSWQHHYYRHRDSLNSVLPESDSGDTQDSPPTAPVPHAGDDRRYTEEDKLYLTKLAKWMRNRDPGCSHREILLEVAKQAPYHSFTGWSDYFGRNKTEIEALLEEPGARPRRRSTFSTVASPGQLTPGSRRGRPSSSISPVRQSSRSRRSVSRPEYEVTPPPSTTGAVVSYRGPESFTKTDGEFLSTYGKWFFKHNSDEGMGSFFSSIAEAAPHHSKSTWKSCYLRREGFYRSKIFELDSEEDHNSPDERSSRARSRRNSVKEYSGFERAVKAEQDEQEEEEIMDDESEEEEEYEKGHEVQRPRSDHSERSSRARAPAYNDEDFDAVVSLHREIARSPGDKLGLWKVFQEEHPTHSLGGWREYARKNKTAIEEALQVKMKKSTARRATR